MTEDSRSLSDRPDPLDRFWMPDESGMGGEEMSEGEVFYEPDARRWMVQVDKFTARPASPDEIPARENATHRVETYRPRPRPEGETEAKIRATIQSPRQIDSAWPRHPSGAE